MTTGLFVADGVLSSIRADVRAWPRRLETGGPLFGFESTRGLVVLAARGVERAQRTSVGFAPDPRDVKQHISDFYAGSDGLVRFIGSWHSHPGGTPAPSATDLANAHRMADDEGVALPRPLFAIASTRRPMPLLDPLVQVAFGRWDPLVQGLVEVTPTELDTDTALFRHANQLGRDSS